MPSNWRRPMPDIDQTLPEDPATEDAKVSRSYETLGTILLVVTVVVVALLLWRSCSADQEGDTATGGGAVIESVEGLEMVEGAVSVWAKEDTDIDAVLQRNGLSGATATDLGEGTWVIEIGDVNAATTVERLKKDPALNDAGFLYHDATDK